MTPSFWLDQLEPHPPRPALDGVRQADVCIVGGGFTGLWLAYALRRSDPAREVVVLEAERVGFGASGRNGGWVQGEVSGSAKAWRRRGGPDAPVAMERAMRATLPNINEAIERERIECDWQQGGSLIVAQTPPQLARLRDELEHERGVLGDAASWQFVSEAELRRRVVIRDGVGALFTPHCARVQPAKLVAGLATAAERAGAVIHEGTRVVGVEPGIAQAVGASVRARHVILATEAYTASIKGHERTMSALGNFVVATEPIPQNLWGHIGLANRELFEDSPIFLAYGQRTADDRIVWGGLGAPYWYGSKPPPSPMQAPDFARRLKLKLVERFPVLKDIEVTHHWGGVMGMTRDQRSGLGYDRTTGEAWIGGFGGAGVAPTNAAGRTLADLITGAQSDLLRFPWVNHRSEPWEPEPLRWLGITGMKTRLRIREKLARLRS